MHATSNAGNDEQSIQDEDVLWRFIAPNQVVEDHNLGSRFRPQSGAFSHERLSVLSARLAFERGRTPENITEDAWNSKWNDSGIVSFTAGFARREGYKVVPDPPQRGDNNTDPAHCLVIGEKKQQSKKDRFAKNCKWVKAPQGYVLGEDNNIFPTSH